MMALMQRSAVHGPRRPARLLVAIGLALGLATVTLACGDTDELAICPAYDDLVDARGAVQDLDFENSNAGETAAVVDEYLSSVHQLQAAADGRYGTVLDALEVAVNDLLVTLDSVQDDADYETWAPVVRDTAETAADAGVAAEQQIGASCEAES